MTIGPDCRKEWEHKQVSGRKVTVSYSSKNNLYDGIITTFTLL
jgi:hypothetical protein